MLQNAIHMKRAIFFILFSIPLAFFGQDLQCKDFLEGKFVGTTPQFPGVEWIILRTQNSQKEWPSVIPKKYKDLGYPTDTIYTNIKQLDNCNYRFLYDEEKMILNSSGKEMNNSGGLFVKKIKIEGRCYFYESKTRFNGNDLTIKGKICKSIEH